MKGYFLAVLLVLSFTTLHAQQPKTDQSCFSGESTKQCQQRKVDAMLAQMDANAAQASVNEIPKFDVVQHCDVISRTTGSASEIIKNSCLNQEQNSYDHMKSEWPVIPLDIREQCESVARSVGPPSYLIMNSCIDQEVQAAKQNQNFQFHR